MAIATAPFTAHDLVYSHMATNGLKIEAIKLRRELSGEGLKDAKDYVEALPMANVIMPDLTMRVDQFKLLLDFTLKQINAYQELRNDAWEKVSRETYCKVLDNFYKEKDDAIKLRHEVSDLQKQVENGSHWRQQWIEATKRIHDLEHYITELAMAGTDGMPLRGFRKAKEDSRD